MRLGLGLHKKLEGRHNSCPGACTNHCGTEPDSQLDGGNAEQSFTNRAVLSIVKASDVDALCAQPGDNPSGCARVDALPSLLTIRKNYDRVGESSVA